MISCCYLSLLLHVNGEKFELMWGSPCLVSKSRLAGSDRQMDSSRIFRRLGHLKIMILSHFYPSFYSRAHKKIRQQHDAVGGER